MGGTDEKQNEYKSLRTRREPATAPAWALSWGIEMAKTENRKQSGKGTPYHRPRGERDTALETGRLRELHTHPKKILPLPLLIL